MWGICHMFYELIHHVVTFNFLLKTLPASIHQQNV